MNKIVERIENLRKIMVSENLDALYISGTDPHISEYLPDRYKTREFITGFTGSYGEIVITATRALLWTDTRYFIQAENQLEGTGVQMQKLRVPGSISFDEWLTQNLKAGNRVGVNPECLPFNLFKKLRSKFENSEIDLVLCGDLLDRIWDNRPENPNGKIFELDIKYAGKSRSEKFEIISEKLKISGADIHVISALDDLAWTFNLRGNDINYNPVFTGYGIVGKGSNILFADATKISKELSSKLKSEGVELYDYNRFFDYLRHVSDKKIFIDPDCTNVLIVESFKENCEIVEGTSIPSLLKAIKNSVELDGFRVAMRKDGVALVKFLYWIKQNIGKIKITEYTVGRKLAELRADEENFKGESFVPIVGYKDHGAIVHLSVDEQSANTIEKDGFLLFDSGGQYYEGTTDVTRTIALGSLTKQQKRDFTLVLKGVIALSEVKFPFGTKGCHLDILARKALWDYGINYGHGTGHGVGHFLAVHEGPMSIRQEYNLNPIVSGMVMSNEPAMYREGEYGIRTENMIVCVEKGKTEFGQFLGFETLTLCPIDVDALDKELLLDSEKKWINNYHEKVTNELKPYLNDELNSFLSEITQKVM